MASTSKTRTIVRDEQPDYGDDFNYPEATTADLDEPESAALCPVCRELLAWHEQACTAVPIAQSGREELPVATTAAARLAFAYPLGHVVQPVASVPGQVIWRGQVRERHPATGLVHRVNVYRLDNSFWDCYYEEELQAAQYLPGVIAHRVHSLPA